MHNLDKRPTYTENRSKLLRRNMGNNIKSIRNELAVYL